MDFKVGDLVQLKPSGPVMTIKSLRYDKTHPDLATLLTRDEKSKVQEGEIPNVSCQWFVKNKLQEGEFAPASLVKAENNQEVTEV